MLSALLRGLFPYSFALKVIPGRFKIASVVEGLVSKTARAGLCRTAQCPASRFKGMLARRASFYQAPRNDDDEESNSPMMKADFLKSVATLTEEQKCELLVELQKMVNWLSEDLLDSKFVIEGAGAARNFGAN